MKQLHHYAGRQAIGGKSVLGGELSHLGRHRPVAADHASVHCGVGRLLQALRLLVSHTERVDQRQSGRGPRCTVALAELAQKSIRDRVPRSRASDSHRRAIRNPENRRDCGLYRFHRICKGAVHGTTADSRTRKSVGNGRARASRAALACSDLRWNWSTRSRTSNFHRSGDEARIDLETGGRYEAQQWHDAFRAGPDETCQSGFLATS